MRLSAIALVLAVAGASVGAKAQEITGAGATFPAPIYTKWGEAARSAIGVVLNYQAIGSGGGQNQIFNRTVDFGASDAPVAAEALHENDLLQFPTVMGAVVPIVNIPGVGADQLKLSGPLLADIFHGRIAKWNDPRLVAMNRGVPLPDLAIAPVHRADASGTSFVFTSYLATVSPAWKDQVGAGVSVNWPAGAGARGNDGVAATVHNTRGGVGYVEYVYAAQNKLTTVRLRNQAGSFVTPTMASFRAAAASADWGAAKNYAVSLIDQPGDATWPIVSATFILLPKNPTDASRSASVIKFFDWAYRQGGPLADQLDYIPLPLSVQDSVRNAWRTQVKAGGKSVYE